MLCIYTHFVLVGDKQGSEFISTSVLICGRKESRFPFTRNSWEIELALTLAVVSGPNDPYL